MSIILKGYIFTAIHANVIRSMTLSFEDNCENCICKLCISFASWELLDDADIKRILEHFYENIVKILKLAYALYCRDIKTN